MKYLDLASAHPLPIRVRLRVALDILGSRSTTQKRSRVSVKEIVIAATGKASVARLLGSHIEVATLLWEIVAARTAESDDLPWSDPAEDLPDAVLDVFAAWSVRRPTSMEELRSRFIAAVEPHTAASTEVAALVQPPEPQQAAVATPLAPRPANPITVRAPAMQVQELQTLSRTMDHALTPPAAEEAPAEAEEDLFATRRCSVAVVEELVALTQVQPSKVEPAAVEPIAAPSTPASIEHSGSLEPFATEDTAASANAEIVNLPRRNNARSFVAASLLACAAVLVVAGIKLRERGTVETAPAHEAAQSETAAPVIEAPPAAAMPVEPAVARVDLPKVVTSVAASSSISAAPASAKPPPPRVVRRAAPAPVVAAEKPTDANPPIPETPPTPTAEPAPAADPPPVSAGAPPPVEL